MRVHHDGQINCILDRGNEIISSFRREDTGHVLDADGADAHGGKLLDHLDVFLERVDRAGGVGDRAGSHRAGVDGLFHSDLQVVDVVEGVKNTDDVDAVADGGADEAAHNVVRIVLVAENVLTAKQHLELGVGQLGAKLAQALPRVFAEEAQTHVKGGTAPAFDGVEARFVNGVKDRLKLIIAEPGCDQRLVGVTQHGFGKLYFLHGSSCDCLIENHWIKNA